MRKVVDGEQPARDDLGAERTRPPWLERQLALPFGSLSPDEFEVLSYLLLRCESPGRAIIYYGKTGDAGRDIYLPEERRVVQCKRYERSVGVGAVREELAKLYVNVSRGILPVRPERLTFFITSDLTADALDLLQSQATWRAGAEQWLRSYLGTEPEAALLDLAQAWWPTLDWQTGVDLTGRVRKFPGLRDEFFEVRKVIEGDLDGVSAKIGAVDVTVKRMLKQQEEMLLLLRQDGPGYAGLQEVLKEAERDNPGLSFRAEATAGSTTFIVSARESVQEVPVGKMSFPHTEAGRRGAAKLQKLIDEGRTAEFAPGEVTWAPEFRLPLAMNLEPGRIVLGNNIPRKVFPVRLDILTRGLAETVFPFAELQVERVGRKEFALKVSGGQIAGSAHLTIAVAGEGSKLEPRIDLTAAPAALALRTAEFFRRVFAGEEVVISWLETGAEAARIRLEKDDSVAMSFQHTCDLLRDLVLLSHEFQVDLRYPERLDPVAAHEANILARGIRAGRATELRPGRSITMGVRRAELGTFLSVLRNPGQLQLRFEHDAVEYDIFGHKLTVPVTTLLLDPHPLDLEAAEAEVGRGGPEDHVSVQIACSGVEYEFPRWLKQNHGPAT